MNWEERAKETRLRIGELDEDLLDRCFLEALNKARQKHNRSLVAYSDRLDATATEYASEMTRNNFFGHVHPKNKSLKTPADRIKKYWPDVVMTGENLAEFSPFKISTMRAKYYARENPDGSIIWLDQRKRPLELHTYWSYANFITDQWLNSKGHRENLLRPDFEFVGMGYNPASQSAPEDLPVLCVVQNFGSP